MSEATYRPTDVMPQPLGQAVDPLPFWFVIGGQAMRCFAPYRPSRDVDFGVAAAQDFRELVEKLAQTGAVEVHEQSADTVHLTWNGIKVSVFLLPQFTAVVTDRRLTLKGLLATKLHAILDRGTRRDFFDLYVAMQLHRVSIIETLRAIRDVYQVDVNEGLLLRALCYFDDAERETPLPNEGSADWATVKAFFTQAAGRLLLPPDPPLTIQKQIVDVLPAL